jgi:hypothetical protein
MVPLWWYSRGTLPVQLGGFATFAAQFSSGRQPFVGIPDSVKGLFYPLPGLCLGCSFGPRLSPGRTPDPQQEAQSSVLFRPKSQASKLFLLAFA